MSEIVERVTRAIYAAGENLKGQGKSPAEGVQVLARAAIEAMREPTEAMQEAGGSCGGFEFDGESGTIYPAPIWRAMIDAALGEKP